MSTVSVAVAVGADRARPPIRVRLDRISALCAALLVVETATVMALSGTVETALGAGAGTVMIVFALVFCLRAVTVSGFIAAAGAAGLVLLEPGWLPPVLGGALLLAIGCGLSPGWVRVERWQAQSTTTPTMPKEVVSGAAASPDGRRTGARALLGNWRSDRVVAVLVVLVFPPSAMAGALWFVTWMAGR